MTISGKRNNFSFSVNTCKLRVFLRSEEDWAAFSVALSPMVAHRSPTLVSLADYECEAQRRLDPGALAYVSGGAGDELTMRENAAAWQRLAIRPRVLVGVGQRDPGTTLLGKRRPHPLIIAPMAFQRFAHRDGELASARAAAKTGAIVCLATLASTTAPRLAHAVPDAPRWFQLYVFADRGVSRELVAQAVEHGYEALVVTVDLPVLGVRERELRTPLQATHAEQIASAAAAGAQGTMTPPQFASLIDADLKWSDIEQFVGESPIPVLVKGILTPEDARLAAEHGAAGVVVSNHGGRQLDTVFTGAEALPEIAAAVGERIDVLVDGGIRRGTDVLKALSLGARAVMVGRPVIWGLAVDGADGAARVLEILLSEFDTALALAGAPRAAALDGSFVAPAPWAPPRQ